MKNIYSSISLLLCLFTCSLSYPQHGVANLVKEEFERNSETKTFGDLFNLNENFRIKDSKLIIENEIYLSLNQELTKRIIGAQPKTISIKIPKGKGDYLILDLVNFTNDYADIDIITASGKAYNDDNRCAMYRGVVRGKEETSLVSICIFENEVYGVIGDGTDNLILAKLNKRPEHILYNDKDFKAVQGSQCGTEDKPLSKDISTGNSASRESLATLCLKMYFETEYDMFQDKGSVAAVVSYVKGVHNCVATLFSNENINVRISALKVWDVDDIVYTSVNNVALWNQFIANTPQGGYNGNLGQLLTFRPVNGGAAATGGMCNANTDFGLSVAPIYNGYFSFPDLGISYPYSWTVNVMTHEFGHTMGSPHTHACAWNGNNTAIDGCGILGGYPAEGPGSCSTGPIPSTTVKGTIMSYCHLNNNPGIAFSNGFGLQPGALIQSAVANATCLQVCCLTSYTGTGTILSGITDSQETTNDITLINKIDPHGIGIYHAGELILLSDGFYAANDSRLRAYIDYCGGIFVGRPANTEGVNATIDEKKEISIFPNPASSVVNIDLKKSKIKNIRIYSIDGKLVLSKEISNESDFVLDVSALKKGFYVLQLDTEEEKNMTEKFFKE